MSWLPRRRVDWSAAAARRLERLPAGDAARLRGPSLDLALDAWPRGVSKVSGSEFWRQRVGHLRIVYHLDEDIRRVVVLRVARRSESSYRGLPRK